MAVAFLLTTAVATAASGLAPFVRRFFLAVAMGLFIVMSVPTSGGAVPAPMLPTFFQDVHRVMPLANGLDALRGILYFDGAASQFLGDVRDRTPVEDDATYQQASAVKGQPGMGAGHQGLRGEWRRQTPLRPEPPRSTAGGRRVTNLPAEYSWNAANASTRRCLPW
ncbi:hypothetical protein ACFOZ0_04790 [Streptomyces yaanensis]|uniref:Uncharacterized protein n=1 Tax=Streptomyces yaanensis TaxID=1142239 RepID=A0ABV7S6A4_9ACTN|nr:hypothetical protein [Streptomyces sp. CGMCC 4.7035]WNC03361.1 hypothetical protein Q2K21_20010 [Streptomyces sp. CGMCC 4.7035]